MIDQPMPWLVPDEHSVDLVNIAAVLVLRFRDIGDTDRVPLVQQNAVNPVVVSPRAIEMCAHMLPYADWRSGFANCNP